MAITREQEEQVNRLLKAEDILKEISYRTDTIHLQGENIRCFCPIHKESIFRSLSVNIVRNMYKCGYTMCDGFHGDTLLDLYARAKGITREESTLYWAKRLKIDIVVPAETTEEDIPKVSATSRDTPVPKLEVTIAQRLAELDNKPDDRELRKQLAELYIKAGDIPNAVDHYMSLVLHCTPTNDNQEAILYLEKVLELDPTNNRAKKSLAQAYLQTGKRDLAIQLWSTAAKSFANTKEFQESIELYSELVHHDPLNPEWRSELSSLLIKVERIPDAVRELKLLADFHVQRGQIQEAFTTYEKIISLTPQDLDAKKRAIATAQRLNQPERVVQYELDIVEFLLTSGNVTGAVESLHQALGETPGNILLRKKLAEVLLQSGATEEAIHQLGALAQLYIDTNDISSAASTYQQLAGLQPQNMNLLEKMVGLYEKLGYQKESIDVYSRIASLHLAQRAIEPAIAALKRCLEIDPGNTRMQSALASAYIREKSQTKATDVLIALAKRYQMDGDLDRARRSYERILEFNPTALPAHEGLIEIYHVQENPDMMVHHLCEIAEIYRQRDEFTPALLRVRQALSLHTSKTEPLALQAKIYTQIESIPRAIFCYYKLSTALASQHKLAEATEAAQQALAMNGNVAKVREHLASLYIQMGLKGDALSELRNLGTYYEKNKKILKSINVLEKAKQIDPSNLGVLEFLARLYEQQNKTDEAKSIYFALGKTFSEKGLLDDAIESYQRVLSLDPTHQEAISNLANTYLEVGATQEAIEQFQELITIHRNQRLFGEAIEICKQILQLNSRNADTHQILVDTYLEIGEQKEALTHLLILADIYCEKQDYKKAVDTYKKVLSLSPNTLSAYAPLAEIYSRQGKTEESVGLYEDYLKLCQTKGLVEEVIETYRRLIEMNPKEFFLREKLAEYQMKNGQTLESLMEYDAIAGFYLEQKKYNKVIETYKKMKEVDPGNEEIKRALAQVEQLAKEKI
jgi:tetratricopeptide (TPR) repeat protein